MRKSNVPTLLRAGADLRTVNTIFRTPLAPSKKRSKRVNRNTRTTLNNPGETPISRFLLSKTIPEILNEIY